MELAVLLLLTLVAQVAQTIASPVIIPGQVKFKVEERKTIVARNERDVLSTRGGTRPGRGLHPAWRQEASFQSLSSRVITSDPEIPDKETASKEAFLDIIDDISRGIRCLNYHYKDFSDSETRHVFLPKELDGVQDSLAADWNRKYGTTANRVSLLASILSQYNPQMDSYKLLRSSLDHLVRLDESFFRVRINWLHQPPLEADRSQLIVDYFVHLERRKRLSTESYNRSVPLTSPWLQLPKKGRKNQYLDRILKDGSVMINVNTFSRDELSFSEWTRPYYSCDLKKWLISYTSLIVSDLEQMPGNNLYTMKGIISIDIDVSNTDFNQCDESDEDSMLTESLNPETFPLHGSHKCDRTSSQCVFRTGWGWRRGGYTCKCKDGFYSSSSVDEDHSRHAFNGSLVESAWRLKNQRKGLAYDMIYTCKKCAEGCESCVDGSACLSPSNWSVRVSLFFVSILVITLALLLVYYLYPY